MAELPPDTLNEIGVLKRREIEARILMPVLEALGARSMEDWKRGDALEMDVLAQSGEEYAFNVTRCRYAELYRALGIAEVGALLSCNRDFSLIEGFNPDIELTRTQTIMQGASHCDVRFALKKPAAT